MAPRKQIIELVLQICKEAYNKEMRCKNENHMLYNYMKMKYSRPYFCIHHDVEYLLLGNGTFSKPKHCC
jgi:hypothetical protein